MCQNDLDASARMIHLFSTGLLLCMSGLSYERVIEVAPGSDVSERCETDSWDRTSADAVELKLNNTAYLLVQNFQQKGLYRCSSKEITLEKKHGISAGLSLLYRGVGQSAHLFCNHLGPQLCNGRWTHKGSRQMTPDRGGNNFSLHMPTVKWDNSGKYECEISCGGTRRHTSYELIVVNVTVQPECVYEGGNMTLCCSLSHLKTPGQLCWVNLDHNIQQVLHRYRSSRSQCANNKQTFCYHVSGVQSEQSHWACAVLYEDKLRALLPARVTVSKHTTTHTPLTHTTRAWTASSLQTTHNKSTENDRDTTTTQPESSPGMNVEHMCVMSVFGLVVLLMVTLSVCLLSRRTNKSVEVCEEEDQGKKAEEDEGAEGLLPQRGNSVTYAVVHFKRKPTESLRKERDVASSDPLPAASGSHEEDCTVIYAGLKMNSEE